MSDWTFEQYVSHNVVSGGYFKTAVLYRDGKKVSSHTWDGTLWQGYADRKARKKIREWIELYGAKPL